MAKKYVHPVRPDKGCYSPAEAKKIYEEGYFEGYREAIKDVSKRIDSIKNALKDVE